MKPLTKHIQAGMWQSAAFDWTTTPEWKDWVKEFQSYMGPTGPNAKATVETFGNAAILSGNRKWAGGVLAPNGKIYCAPFYANGILVIDPDNGSITKSAMGADMSGTSKWWGGILGKDGKIYFIPFNADAILIVDPDTDTATKSRMGISHPNIGWGSPAKWIGGVLATDHKIYGMPCNSSGFLIIDPATNSGGFELRPGGLTGPASTSTLASGGVLGKDGKVYTVPRNAPGMVQIDTDTGTYTWYPHSSINSNGDKWMGGALDLDGAVYAAPYGEKYILKIDTDNKTVSQTGSGFVLGQQWAGAVLATNNKIYCIPHTRKEILGIDLAAQTAGFEFGDVVGTQKWMGGVMAHNRKIYGIPYSAQNILVIDTDSGTTRLPDHIVLDTRVNKF